MAAMAYRLAVGVVNGHMPEKDIVLLPPHLVTTENVDTYKGWGG